MEPACGGSDDAGKACRLRTYYYKALFERSEDCLFFLKPGDDGRLVYDAVNSAGMRHVGHPWEETAGRRPVDILHAGAGAIIDEKVNSVFRTGNAVRYQATFAMAQGETRFDAIYSLVDDDSGRRIGVLGAARDVSDLWEAEQQIRQTQKMEALGELAGGVAHDFNNLLSALQGCLTLVGKHVDTDYCKNLLAEGLKSIERGSALTARLLAFARRQPSAIESVDFRGPLLELRDLLRRTLGGAVCVETDISADLLPASANKNEVELAIINLAINSRDAMPDGGTLTLSARNAEGEPRYIALAVRDTGSGIPPEMLEKVVEPFFTTKEEGKGTGLGLSLVANLAETLGGKFVIESVLGHGTTATLFLPRAS
jgi:PAS domain S-box-containing protein